MKRFVRNILAREFVIDEQPVPVWLSRDEGSEDLFGLMSRLLVENDRLHDLTERLRSESAGSVEIEKFMKALLPTLDSFDWVLNLARSQAKSEEVDNWLKSVESIYFRVVKMLENYGLYQLKCVGKKVDLDFHEVVEYRESADHPNDVIISERQKGYVFRGKLLRDAKVVVAYNPGR